MCLLAIAALAQEKADIVVSYECRYPGLVSKEVKKDMTLLANSSKSKYFNDISLWTDSLSSTPEGKAKLDEIIRANCLVMHPDGYQYFFFTDAATTEIYTIGR